METRNRYSGGYRWAKIDPEPAPSGVPEFRRLSWIAIEQVGGIALCVSGLFLSMGFWALSDFAARLGISVVDLGFQTSLAVGVGSLLGFFALGFVSSGVSYFAMERLSRFAVRLAHNWVTSRRLKDRVPLESAIPALLAVLLTLANTVCLRLLGDLNRVSDLFVVTLVIWGWIGAVWALFKEVIGGRMGNTVALVGGLLMLVMTVAIPMKSVVDAGSELADEAQLMRTTPNVPSQSTWLAAYFQPIRGEAVWPDGTSECVVRISSSIFLTTISRDAAADLRDSGTIIAEPTMFREGCVADDTAPPASRNTVSGS